jgi:hypothetical protein
MSWEIPRDLPLTDPETKKNRKTVMNDKFDELAKGLPKSSPSFVTRLLLCLGLALSPLAAGADQVQEVWAALYPTNFGDIGGDSQAIAVDGTGNVYITGYPATVKYDPNGRILWATNRGEVLALDGLGNVCVSSGFWTSKYDRDGHRLWQSTNGPVGIAVAIAIDGAQNVIVTGQSQGDYATVKHDSNGNILWVAQYDGPAQGTDLPYAMALDSAGNIFVTGSSQGTDSALDYATVKYDPNGNELWVARYNGPGNTNDTAKAIAVDSAGRAIVTGVTDWGWSIDPNQFIPYENADITTIQYSSDGQPLWVARYAGLWFDEGTAVAVDSASNVLVAGFATGGNGYADYVTIKYDPGGNQLWAARFEGAPYYDNIATALALDKSGNVYVTGASRPDDCGTVKYDPNGYEKWRALTGFGHPVITGLKVDDAGYVYVTGYSSGSDVGQYYAVTLKYTQSDLAGSLLMAPQRLTNGQFSFTLVGSAGGRYTIQASSNLLTWSSLTNFISYTGVSQFTDTTAPSFSHKFYRAVTP